MPSSIHRAAASGFERGAADYELGRPGYPHRAVDWLLDVLAVRGGTRVLDLAAGTGKLTRELARAGTNVTAVEPVRAMREALAAALPTVNVLDGTAEAIPLPERAVDAVTAAQAFHWFDGERALAEIHRVLRPGGRLALVWNKRENADPLQRRITEITEPYRGDTPGHASLRWKEAFDHTRLFTPLEERRLRWTHVTDADGLVARVTSISFIATLPEAERRSVVERARALVRPGEPVVLAYDTHLYWCERAATSAA